jgi:hypothetical protein
MSREKSFAVTDEYGQVRSGHRSLAATYISGTGIAGSDNSAMTLKTVSIPANTLWQVGDRMLVRTYWKGDTGTAVVGTVKVNGVTVSDTTDAGGATLQLNEAWLHYIDDTHANIIENEAGALGSLSAVNVAGFDWDAAQDCIFTQSASANNHAILYALILDVFPKATSG